jgi:hypothetical protein
VQSGLTFLLNVILIYCCPSEILELFEIFPLNLLALFVLNSVHETSACTELSRQLFLYQTCALLLLFRTRI